MDMTREDARRFDERATRELGIPGVVLMENAGRGAAEVVRERFAPFGRGRVVVFAGAGNNGGDGFVVARHLALAGAAVRVHLCGDRAKLPHDAAVNLRILERMGIPIGVIADERGAAAAADELASEDVAVDALLGTGFRGEVRAPTSTLIERINRARRRAIVAIDLPSGLDCDRGTPSNATIRAALTITFVAPKAGFAAPGAAAFTGEVVVRGIGAPAPLPPRPAA